MDVSLNLEGGIHFVLAWILLFVIVKVIGNGLGESFKGGILQGGRSVMQQLHKLPQAGSTPAPATIHSVSSSVGQSAGLWHRMSAVRVRSHTPHGLLAQLVERQTEDLRVPGSIPGESTK